MNRKWSGADMRCQKCNKYLPDRCTCNGPSIEQRRNMTIEEIANSQPMPGSIAWELGYRPPMNHPTTAQEYVNRWHAGETLTSISMGGKGMGSGYEHAIQQTAVVILTQMLAINFDFNAPDEKLAESWKIVELACADDPDLDDGISGAMFYAARNLAAHFYRKGPAHVMTEEVVAKRQIRVSKHSTEIDWMANE